MLLDVAYKEGWQAVNSQCVFLRDRSDKIVVERVFLRAAGLSLACVYVALIPM